MNIYIETWKSTINSLITAHKILYENNNAEYNLSKKTNDIRTYASKQLSILDDTKKDKTKSMYAQANEQQKEFIDYLEKVIIYGNLDAKDNINL